MEKTIAALAREKAEIANTLRARIAELEAVLREYADEDNWSCSGCDENWIDNIFVGDCEQGGYEIAQRILNPAPPPDVEK